MERSTSTKSNTDCWRGKDDSSPFVPGRPETIPQTDSMRELFESMRCCTRCDLARERTQVVPGVGPADARVMFVGEAPGAQEDREGEPFVGRAGGLLDRLLSASGLDRDDVFITNIVACRPPDNRNPRVGEIRAHTPWLDAQLRIVAPDVLVTLGRVALTYFVPKAKVTELRGDPMEIEHDGREITLLPLLHPAAALRRRSMLPEMEENFAKIPGLLGGASGSG